MKIGITIFCGSTIICHVAISTKRRALSRETTKKTKKKNRQINKQTYPVSLSATRKTFISVPLCHTNELVDSSLNFQKKKKWNRAMFVTCLPSTSRPVHHFFFNDAQSSRDLLCPRYNSLFASQINLAMWLHLQHPWHKWRIQRMPWTGHVRINEVLEKTSTTLPMESI